MKDGLRDELVGSMMIRDISCALIDRSGARLSPLLLLGFFDLLNTTLYSTWPWYLSIQGLFGSVLNFNIWRPGTPLGRSSATPGA